MGAERITCWKCSQVGTADWEGIPRRSALRLVSEGFHAVTDAASGAIKVVCHSCEASTTLVAGWPIRY